MRQPHVYTVWTPDQAQAVLGWLGTNAPGQVHRAVWLALATGMRIGEILRATWTDLDLVQLTLRVPVAKTPAGRRLVALPPEAAGVLGEPGTGPLFTMHRTTVHRWLARAARAVGCTPIRVHDLRHCHATWLLGNGVNPRVVQHRLGHSHINVTLGIYAHVMPGHDHAAAGQIGAMLRNA